MFQIKYNKGHLCLTLLIQFDFSSPGGTYSSSVAFVEVASLTLRVGMTGSPPFPSERQYVKGTDSDVRFSDRLFQITACGSVGSQSNGFNPTTLIRPWWDGM